MSAFRVGPVLEASAVGRAVATAIERENPGTSVEDHGSYLRVGVDGRCVVTRAAIERAVGRDFLLPGDLELVMPAFAGSFHVTEDEARWTAGAGAP